MVETISDNLRKTQYASKAPCRTRRQSISFPKSQKITISEIPTRGYPLPLIEGRRYCPNVSLFSIWQIIKKTNEECQSEQTADGRKSR
jgi:hypothetical protein